MEPRVCDSFWDQIRDPQRTQARIRLQTRVVVSEWLKFSQPTASYYSANEEYGRACMVDGLARTSIAARGRAGPSEVRRGV